VKRLGFSMSKIEYKCSTCNRINNINNKFCIYCGTKIVNKREEVFSSKEYQEVLASIEGIIVALLAKVAKSDKRINQDEAQYLSNVFDKLCENSLHLNLREILKQILVNEKESLSNIPELCTRLFTLYKMDSYRTNIITLLIELAHIDGVYSTEEENLIIKIVHHLHMDYADYKKIVEHYHTLNKKGKKKSYSGSLTIDECYEILKTSKNADNVTLKKNYRKIVKEYHSDLLKSKELPIDLIDFAEEKLKSINFAYEKLKQHRNF